MAARTVHWDQGFYLLTCWCVRTSFARHTRKKIYSASCSRKCGLAVMLPKVRNKPLLEETPHNDMVISKIWKNTRCRTNAVWKNLTTYSVLLPVDQWTQSVLSFSEMEIQSSRFCVHRSNGIANVFTDRWHEPPIVTAAEKAWGEEFQLGRRWLDLVNCILRACP